LKLFLFFLFLPFALRISASTVFFLKRPGLPGPAQSIAGTAEEQSSSL